MRPADMPTHAELVERYPEKHTHGTRVRYMAGCKCVPCRAAASRYEQLRQRIRNDGLADDLVPATKARNRLAWLRRHGIGLRTVARVGGVSRSVLAKIRSGEREQVRHETERAIFGVTKNATALGVYVDARQAWQRVRWLLAHGWSKARIARAVINPRAKALQINPDRITKRNAQAIERLYQAARKENP